MSTTKTPSEQAHERYPNMAENGRAQYNAEGYATCLEERALPAEEALRVAMEYINSVRQKSTRFSYDSLYGAAWDALRANPITAKMLEE